MKKKKRVDFSSREASWTTPVKESRAARFMRLRPIERDVERQSLTCVLYSREFDGIVLGMQLHGHRERLLYFLSLCLVLC